LAAANLTTPVWQLWLERRPVALSADEARLYELTFFPLARRRFAELARLGRWSDLEAGDVLVRPGQPAEEVVVPLTESVEARVGDRFLGRFAPGEVVGATAFYGRPPRFKAVAGEGCRVLRVPWPWSGGTPSATASSPARWNVCSAKPRSCSPPSAGPVATDRDVHAYSGSAVCRKKVRIFSSGVPNHSASRLRKPSVP
jgi:hypothetical protein